MRFRDYACAVIKRVVERPWVWADTAASLLGILGASLTWFLPKYSAAVQLAAWLIPIAFFAPLFIYRLCMAPYWLLRQEAASSAEVRARLQGIESAAPHLVFDSVRDAQLFRESQITQGRRRIYRLLQVWFKNAPLISTTNSIAKNVSALLEFTSKSEPDRVVRAYGQWMIGNPPDFVASGDLSSEIDIPPGHLPVKLNIALKFEQDSWAYAFSKESLTRELDGRDASAALFTGSHALRIHLKGVGVDSEYHFTLTNPGPNMSIGLLPLE